MKEKSFAWWMTLAGVIGAFLAVMIALVWASCYEENRWQEAAIENGAAYFDPLTKEFTWVKRKPVEITQKRLVQTPDGKMWIESPDGTREPYEMESGE